MRKSVFEKANTMIGKINARYDLRYNETSELIEKSEEVGTFCTISTAFTYGYMQGMKAAKAEIKQKGGVVNA